MFVLIGCCNGFRFSFTDIMEEELFAQFNKIANSILHSKAKEQSRDVEAGKCSGNTEQIPEQESKGNVKCCKPVGLSGEAVNPAMKVRALQVKIAYALRTQNV